MHKQLELIDPYYLPRDVRSKSIAEKYKYYNEMFNRGHTYIILNNVNVFGPFLKPELPWDISEAEKIAIYNPEVAKVLTWVKTKIIINLGNIDYKTLGVLMRIATGMLNKCNIPKSVQILFHDNMVKNLQSEHDAIIMSDLPF